MVKVRVVKPWDFSVKVGDELTFEFLHSALASHVVVIGEDQDAEAEHGEDELEVATPEPARRGRPPKQQEE